MKKSNALMVLFILSILFVSCSKNSKTEAEIDLWPEIGPFQTNHLKVSDIHEIYYELCGNPDGIPVFVIHGGPGSGCPPAFRRFFNPEKFLIVLHDQRGCGRSNPRNELRENTTQNLVKDIERLRNELGLDKIILFGGSWGSTLSLAYAETYPDNVSKMVLRGIKLGTREEIDLRWQGAIARFFPETWEQMLSTFPDSCLPPCPENNLKLFQIGDKKKMQQCLNVLHRHFKKASMLYL